MIPPLRNGTAGPRALASALAALLLALASCTGGDGSDGPVLRVDGPEPGASVGGSTVTVEGRVSDPDGVASVLVSVDGGPFRSCDVFGNDFVCASVPLATGPNEIRVVAEDGLGRTTTRILTVTRRAPGDGDAGAFDIDLVFYDEDFTSTQRAAFEAAANMWSRVIRNDLQDMDIPYAAGEACRQGEPAITEPVDDLLIFVTSYAGEVGSVLAVAGPCLSRSSGPDVSTNFVGFMEFDTEDLDALQANGQLVDTIAHEMGHVLGFGTNWEDAYHELLDFDPAPGYEGIPCSLVDEFDAPPRYTGSGGRAGYAEAGGSGDVPVEEDHGQGTRCGHWDEEVFGNELMTGILDQRADNPLSIVTIRSLTDIGFEVDAGEAETFTLPALRDQAGGEGLDLAAREVLLTPRGSVDPETGDFTPPPTR